MVIPRACCYHCTWREHNTKLKNFQLQRPTPGFWGPPGRAFWKLDGEAERNGALLHPWPSFSLLLSHSSSTTERPCASFPREPEAPRMGVEGQMLPYLTMQTFTLSVSAPRPSGIGGMQIIWKNFQQIISWLDNLRSYQQTNNALVRPNHSSSYGSEENREKLVLNQDLLFFDDSVIGRFWHSPTWLHLWVNMISRKEMRAKCLFLPHRGTLLQRVSAEVWKEDNITSEYLEFLLQFPTDCLTEKSILREPWFW